MSSAFSAYPHVERALYEPCFVRYVSLVSPVCSDGGFEYVAETRSMNLILHSPAAVPYFTNLACTLKAAEIEVRDFDWFVSDVETNIDVPVLSGNGWFTGEELAQVLATEHLQFIWGVLSAVPEGWRCDVESVPFAQGNASYWSNDTVIPQLRGALFEVVCWDSSATILSGLNDVQADAFMRTFPAAKPLYESSLGQ